MYPENYRYTREHEWIRAEGGGGVIGITHHAQDKLGDIVFVELPAAGRKLDALEAFGSVESVKAVSDIYSPVAGEVTEVNAALADHPEILNQDPHGAGWIIKIKLADPKAVDGLLSARDYEEFVRSEDAT